MALRAPRLIDLIRTTLRRVEESADLEKDGSAVRELKSSVVLTMAEHELRTPPATASAPGSSTEETFEQGRAA